MQKRARVLRMSFYEIKAEAAFQTSKKIKKIKKIKKAMLNREDIKNFCNTDKIKIDKNKIQRTDKNITNGKLASRVEILSQLYNY